MGEESAGAVAAALGVIDLALAACRAYQRPDLLARLEAAKAPLGDPNITLVIAGEFKQGKSSLVNALLGTAVCPVDDDVATAVPTHVRHGEKPAAELLLDGDPPGREPVPVQDLRRYTVEPALPGGPNGPAGSGGQRVLAVEVRLPRALLAGGLVLVDTPGVGGLGSPVAAASLAQISMADAVLFVTDASQELTRSELDFLQQARRLCEVVVVVLTKKDLYPAWRTIRDLDEAHLKGRDLHEASLGVLPVSSTLRARAAKANDAELNRASGFPALVDFVRNQVGGGAARQLAVRAVGEVVDVCRQLESQFEAERTALADPATARRVVEELEAVKSRVEALKHAAARWNQTLNDGVADLGSDIDHDLRARIRAIVQEADEMIESADPAESWSQLEAWLRARTSHELVANYTDLRDRASELSEQVAEHFRQASGPVLDRFAVYHPEHLLSHPVGGGKEVEFGKMSVGKQTMIALRSSYGGTLMFTALGGMAGVALGPIGIGIGLIMGHRGLREEKKRQLTQRRGQARNSVRRYCDEVGFVTGKDSRDTLRRIQRQLRDHYSARAEELQRSTTEALKAATDTARKSQAERETRMRDLDAELGRLRKLRERAEAVAR
jgi:replication fork clamp-binding protein CrfC